MTKVQTQFGENMKMMLERINDAEGQTIARKKAAERKEKKIEYRCESSGIDMVVTRVLNGKDTKRLICYLSQLDANGRPIMVIENKDVFEPLNFKNYNLFADGMDYDIRTGCTAIPTLRKSNEFTRIMDIISANPEIIDIIKMGVLDTDIMQYVMYGSYSYEKPWYTGGAFREDYFNDMIYKENIHIKMVKHAVGYNMRKFGISYNTALRFLYSDSSRENGIYMKKVVNGPMFKAFIILANRYDEPFAIKCMNEYLDNDDLDGLKPDYLGEILRIKQNGKYSRHVYSDCSSAYVPVSLLYHRMSEEREKDAVSFDKNRFWEYIEQAITVGRGTKLDDYLSTWKDYLLMTMDVEGVIKDKYPASLKMAHDIIEEKYDVTRNEDVTEKLLKSTEKVSQICDVDADGWQIRVLRTPAQFFEEKIQQGNCVASYINRCANGDTIVASARPVGSDVSVLTVEISTDTYRFIQIKQRFNREPTSKQMEKLDKLQEKVQKNLERYLEEHKEE